MKTIIDYTGEYSNRLPVFEYEKRSVMPSDFNYSINYTLINDSDFNYAISCSNGSFNPPFFQFLIIFSYMTVMIVAITGNTIVVYIVKSSTRMQSVTNYFIVNLSIGDTLTCLICVPFTFISSLLLRHWPFGGFMCRLVSFWQAVSIIVSAYTMVAISVDRYIAIMFPLKPRMTKTCAKWIIVFLWFIAILTALPIFIVSGINSPDWWYQKCERYVCQEQWPKKEYNFIYSVVIMTLQYAIPFFVLVYTYVRIAIVVWGKKTPGEAENSRDQRLAKGKRKMIRMMVLVVLVFTICWLPFNVMMLMIDRLQHWKGIVYMWFAFHWLAMSHTCYNPIIYVYMNNRFRMGFVSTLSRLRCPKYMIPTDQGRGGSISGCTMAGNELEGNE